MQVPLPTELKIMRPDFFMLFLIYWWLAHPEKVGVFTAFSIGLITDVMHGSLLGQNALGAVLIAWVVLKNYQRIRVLPLYQQAFIVGFLLIVKQLLVFWIDHGRDFVNYPLWQYLISALIAAVFWPWLFVVMRDLRRNAAKN